MFEIAFKARNAYKFEDWETIICELIENFLFFDDEDRFESELKDSLNNFITGLKELKKHILWSMLTQI